MREENIQEPFNLKLAVAAAAIAVAAIFGAVYLYVRMSANEPPKISGVRIAEKGDKIVLAYQRSDPDGPERRDAIRWEFGGVEKKEYKNMRECPAPEGFDRVTEISCVVEAFDGIDYSRRVRSNTIKHFRASPKAVEMVEADEDAGLTLIQKIHKRNTSGYLQPPPPAPYEVALKTGTSEAALQGGTIEAALAQSTAESGFARATSETSVAQQEPTVEVTLKGNLKDILTDRNVEGAVVRLGGSEARTSRWGDYELSAPVGTHRLTVTSPDHYKRTIAAFALTGDETYNDFLIPRSFEIEAYDEVARSRLRPYTDKWENPPTIVINNGPHGYVNYVATSADRATIKDTIRNDIAPYLGWNIYSLNNNVTIIEDDYNLYRNKYDGPGYIVIFFEPRMDGAALGECSGRVNYNCQIVLKSKDRAVIIHEFLHALGFRLGHSSRKSIMTSEKSQESLTELDRQILKIHSRLRVGTTTPHDNITKDGR